MPNERDDTHIDRDKKAAMEIQTKIETELSNITQKNIEQVPSVLATNRLSARRSETLSERNVRA